MLNLKKGLALVLAAATALTFAPVANLGNAVEASAASNPSFDNITDFSLTQNGGATFDAPQFSYSDGAEYKVTVGDTSVIDVRYEKNNQTISGNAVNVINQRTPFTVFAKKAGKSTVTLEYTVNGGSKYSKTVTVTVNPEGDNAWARPNTPAANTHGDGSVGNPYVVVVDPKGSDHLIFNPGDNSHFESHALKSVTSADDSVIKVNPYTQQDVISQSAVGTNGEKLTDVTLTYLKSGNTTITINYTMLDKTSNQEVTGSKQVYFRVIAKKSIFKVDSTEVGEGNLVTTTPIVKTIALSADRPTADLNVTLDDAQTADEKVTYIGVADRGTSKPNKPNSIESYYNNDKTVNNYASKDLVIENGQVRATATALSGVEKYYDIAVSNVELNNNGSSAKTGVTAKTAIIRVVASRTGTNFTKATAQVDNGEVWTATAEYAANGTVKDANVQKAVTLSTKDKQSVAFAASTNVGAAYQSIKSQDTSIVSIENNTLVAHKVGVTTVTISAKSDTTHYGNATIDITVTVNDKYINNKIEAKDVYLTKLNRKANIEATVTPATTLSYRLVQQTANNTYVAATDSNIKLNDKTGEVEYLTTNAGKALVEISGASTNDAQAPQNAYVTVYYSSEKLPSRLDVTTRSLNLEVNATGSIVASGSALSFKSDNTDVATVDGTGVVTAVKPGVAVITVTDAGNDNYLGGTDEVTVYVAGSNNNETKTYANPKKVSGVKVTNKKGAVVRLTFKKDKTDPNVQYKVQKQVRKNSKAKWSKVSSKKIGSTKTTLSVKKGYQVRTRVKAFYYDENKNLHAGKYSKWVTKKTDKK